MNANQYDLVIVGGGLAGSLLLKALQVRHPHLRYLLLEKSDKLGGTQTWSFHDADLPKESRQWLTPLLTQSWNSYDVRFPEYSRTFQSAFHSVTSQDLHDKLSREYPNSIRFNSVVKDIQHDDICRIKLESGETIQAESVVLARGWTSPYTPSAWQKFVGLDVELEQPHGLERVLLMDACVQQIDGFRFFQLLPWSPTRLMLQDTYYSHHNGLKVERIEQEVHAYLNKRGWKVKSIRRHENGALPLIMELGHDQLASGPNLPKIGADSGFFHPVSGYTVPTLLRQITAITEKSNLTISSIQKAVESIETDAKVRLRYSRMLNRVIFKAAQPTERYKVLSHFYKMPDSLIQRFYAGQTNLFDQLRILVGRPPVSVRKALAVIKEEP